jgi:hypothetical protein
MLDAQSHDMCNNDSVIALYAPIWQTACLVLAWIDRIARCGLQEPPERT